jgi:pimeloyl-ACP methyl ester carboxylesterase
MTQIAANGIFIEYDAFGDPSHPAVLLISGLGVQMIYWDETFCRRLAGEGHYIVRFDNRDIGLSTKFGEFGAPDIPRIASALERGEKPNVPYTLDDMSDDAVGLLDGLGIEKAHFCGSSMGGIIAQTAAYRHPHRVLGLISIMSSSGDPDLPAPKPEIMNVLLTPSPDSREEYIEHNVRYWKTVGSRFFTYDEQWIRRRAATAFDRCHYPFGKARQMAAIMARGNRRDLLKSIQAPTLVIHGTHDPLVPVEAGMDIADTIPNARLVMIEGMGHDMPTETWPEIINAIAEHTKSAHDRG